MLENLTDEEFNNYYNITNLFTTIDSTYAYISYNDNSILPTNEVVAELKTNKNNSQGHHLLKTTLNNDETNLKRTLNIIYNSYESGKVPNDNELIIDSEFLNNNLILDFLKKCYENNYINKINIIGNDYILDEETFNKINFFNRISVNNSSFSDPKIRVGTSKYKAITGKNENNEDEYDLIIKNNINNDKELLEIIKILNNATNNQNLKIDIRFYNPNRVVDLIERLDKLGLDKRIDIKILGYTLTENSDIYKKLIPITKNRNIEVQYVCCHDLLGEYTQEPYIVGNFYDSELEPSGKTDLSTYIKMLEFIEAFEQKVDGINSNIEKVMMAYQYLNNNYYYDLNAGSTKNYGDTRDLDKILDTDQIVCTGYANLLCLMCRRVGIPMFTYDAPQHSANIARVQEKDESGNIIFDKICTFDPTNDSGFYNMNNETGEIEKIENKDSYTFFGLNPEESLHRIDKENVNDNVSYMTLANVLSIDPNQVIKYSGYSSSPYFGSYTSWYTPLSYMYSMLHLMGYNYDETTDMLDVIAELQERERIGEIPEELIYNSAKNIEKRKHQEMTEEEFNNHIEDINKRIDQSIRFREYFYDFDLEPRIHLNKYPDVNGNKVVLNVDTYSNSNPEHNYVDIDSIDMGPVYYQELDKISTGNEETNEQEDTLGTEDNNDFSIDDIINDATNSLEELKERHLNELNELKEEHIEALDSINDEYLNKMNEIVDEMNELVTEIDELPENTSIDIAETSEENIQKTPDATYDINNILKSNGITINDNIHVNGNINITINNYGQNPTNLSNITIAGTTIRKPKPQKKEETKEEYSERLDSYYEEYLPKAAQESNTTYRLTRDQIGQDLPIYSLEEQIFNAVGMTDEEIEESRRKLR